VQSEGGKVLPEVHNHKDKLKKVRKSWNAGITEKNQAKDENGKKANLGKECCGSPDNPPPKEKAPHTGGGGLGTSIPHNGGKKETKTKQEPLKHTFSVKTKKTNLRPGRAYKWKTILGGLSRGGKKAGKATVSFWLLFTEPGPERKTNLTRYGEGLKKKFKRCTWERNRASRGKRSRVVSLVGEVF